MKGFFGVLSTLTLLTLVACNDKPSNGSAEATNGLTVTPGAYEITVLSPAQNGTTIGKYSVLSGHCGRPNHPIVVSRSGQTLYSICQNDYTWAAPVSAAGIASGVISFDVSLKDLSLQNGSPIVQRNFLKADDFCSSEANRTKLFANSTDGGNGTTSPYVICTPQQFSNIRNYPSLKYALGQTINFSMTTVIPNPIVFTGELDGRGFALEDFVVRDTAGTGISVGLFRTIAGATIKNLEIRNGAVDSSTRVGILAGDWRGAGQLSDIKIEGTVTGTTMCGGLMGIANAASALVIERVTVKANINCNSYSGGAIGWVTSNDGSLSISQSNFYTNVTGIDNVGGVIGFNVEDNSTFNSVLHKGSVVASGINIGGIIGESAGGSYTNVSHVGDVSSSRDHIDVNVGGLLGLAKGQSIIANSHVVSQVSSGGRYTGGLVGRLHGGSITNSYSRGTVNVNDDYYNVPMMFAGGLVGGFSLAGSIENSSSHMNITGSAYYVGGLVGIVSDPATTINNSYSLGEIQGRVSHIGGLVGAFNGAHITNSFSRANLTITNSTPKAYIGGLVGHVAQPTAYFTRVYATGNIQISEGLADNVGGLIGYAKAQSIQEAFYTGSISGARSIVGGIAGYLAANLSQSFVSSTSIVATHGNVGGIAGFAFESAINDVFAQVQTLQGTTSVGGLVGTLHNAISVTSANMYFTGGINKSANSTANDVEFGAVMGQQTGAGNLQYAYYLNTSALQDLSDSLPLVANTFGEPLTDSQMRAQANYQGFNFATNPQWQMAPGSYTLPFKAANFFYAIPNWITLANFGFTPPQTFSDDPQAAPVPEIFNSLSNVLLGFSEDEINSITSTAPVTTVATGALALTITSPSIDGQSISSKKIISGECGIPGGQISITGSFTINTICQSNHRWAVVLDATNKSLGTLTVNARLHNQAQTSQSPIVTRTLIKGNALCLDTTAINGIFANSHLGADGINTPFKICHAGHFRNIATQPNRKFELADDVDFANQNFEPLTTTFSGELDGKNYKIKNILINRPAITAVALFKVVENATLKNIIFDRYTISGNVRVALFAADWRGTGTVENVHFNQGSITGIQSTGTLAGLTLAQSNLAIDNVTLTNAQVQGNHFTGGLIGYISSNDGQLSAQNITASELHVKGLGSVGGLIGLNLEPNSQLSQITLQGSLEALAPKSGGLIGHSKGGSFTNISIAGNVTNTKAGESVWVGGVLGHGEGITVMNGVQYAGTISAGGDHVGGIAGILAEGQFNNVLSSGTINLTDTRYGLVRFEVGGLIGAVIENSQLSNSSSSMALNVSARYVGGLVGRFGGKFSELRNSSATGNISARTSYVGGLVGGFDGPIVWDSFATGNITVANATPNAHVAGLIGYANNNNEPSGSDYRRLYATGNIAITSGIADYVGGLVGFFRLGSLVESYATGSITGVRNSSGGLVGIMRGDISQSFATGNVTGSLRHLGGLVGYQLNGSIRNSFARGDVTAADQSGGLVGYVNAALNTVTDNYVTGRVIRLADSTYPANTMGAIFANELNANSVNVARNFFRAENAAPEHTNLGQGHSNAQATVMSNYGFNFEATPGWRVPTAAALPGLGSNYPYPIPHWLGGTTAPTDYQLSGQIIGLQHSSVTVNLNGSEPITVVAPNNTFSFTTRLTSGQSYAVTLTAQPSAPAINCVLTNHSGTMGNANVTNITVICPTVQSISIANTETNLSVGSSLAVEVTGLLSNATTIDLSSFADLSVSGSHFSLSGTSLNALTIGTTTVTANYLALSANLAFQAFAPLVAPTAIAWSSASPSATTSITAQWALSVSAGVVSQRIDYFLNAGCTATPIISRNLSNVATSDSYVGTDLQSYSFSVTAIDGNNISATSNCSSTMAINTPNPNPVTGATIAASWRNGALPISSPAYNWTNPSGIVAVQVALGTTSGGTQLVNWTNIGNVSTYTFTGLSGLAACTPYYGSIRTVSASGKTSTPVTTAFWRWDNNAPTLPGAPTLAGIAGTSVTPQVNWDASTDNCQLSQYQVAVGTVAGGTDVVAWHNVGNINSYQMTSGSGGHNFELVADTNYYITIRARDVVGNYSSPVNSAAWQLPSAGLAKYLWLDASEQNDIRDRAGLTPADGGFSGRVYQWLDRGPAGTYDAVGASTTADPSFDAEKNHVVMNGTNQYMTLPTGTQFDNSTFTTKNMFVSFRTATNINTRQVIYEQGNRDRGMNLYLLNGSLYCAFWNNTNNGDGAQAIVSQNTPVAVNTTYHAALIFDYSNYTTSTGPNGVFRCFLNNEQIGSDMSSTSRLFAHSNGAALGAMRSGTRFHDSNSTSTGNYFNGRILEAFSLTSLPATPVVTSLLNIQMSKWSSEELSGPNNLALFNDSTTTPAHKAPRASWSPMTSNYFVTDHYELAIGTTEGGTEILNWSNIGNVTQYDATDGVDDLNFTLEHFQDYYLSIRAVDAVGNKSLTATSQPWQVFPAASLQLAGTFLKLDAAALSTVIDGAAQNASSPSFNNVVSIWNNALGATNNFNNGTTNQRPIYQPLTQALRFDGANDRLSTASETVLTNSTVTQKAVTVVFTTGANVTTQQYLYDQGTNARGMGIYLVDGNLYCLFHNNTNGGDGAQAPLFQSTPVQANTSYVVTLYLDYSNYTTTTGPSGSTGCYVNGALLGTASTTSRLYAINSAVFIGARSNARWHNGNATNLGNYFNGDIHEVQVTNLVPSNAQEYIDLQNALMNKWQ